MFLGPAMFLIFFDSPYRKDPGGMIMIQPVANRVLSQPPFCKCVFKESKSGKGEVVDKISKDGGFCTDFGF